MVMQMGISSSTVAVAVVVAPAIVEPVAMEFSDDRRILQNHMKDEI